MGDVGMALGGNHTDHTVLIYDSNDNHLINTVVTDHDRAAKQLQVEIMPEELKVNDNCRLLVLTTPTPCEYRGKVKKEGGSLLIAMFQGKVKESREATRFKVNTPAIVDTLIVDDKPFPLHKPVVVRLINISTGGVRFRAPYHSFSDQDVFQMHLEISNVKKKLTVQVINNVDHENVTSDYGCRFLGSG